MPPAPVAAGLLSADPLIQLRVDGAEIEVSDDGSSLLDVLRDRLGLRTVKDGCSPQGQCGCCTVWVDGSPRVACVTPARRVAGRTITTLGGLPVELRDRWARALAVTGGSQCGFCTPGIIMRLAGVDTAKVSQALAAHLCRCTGWQTIEEAARLVDEGTDDHDSDRARDVDAAEARATIEGGVPQRVGPAVALGCGGFADDGAPLDALVAIPDGRGGYEVAESLHDARIRIGKVQGRRTTLPAGHPVGLADGTWELVLQTGWIEPAYLEPDASWCVPGGVPASSCANGGSFGGKRRSPVGDVARSLAGRHHRPVRVLWSREDVVQLGPKRPPVSIAMADDGTGVLRFGVTLDRWNDEQMASAIRTVHAALPGVSVDQVLISGPPVSMDLRGALWAEAVVMAACFRELRAVGPGAHTDVPIEIVSPTGGRAVARCHADRSISVAVDAGEVLDRVVLRSYCIGAAHQALGWVTSEGISVDKDGIVNDLTVRSFGIVRARAMPRVDVTIEERPGDVPVNGSDAVFAAVAAARWLADGLGPVWPTRHGLTAFA
jgi:xanthine dehydrogenase small subunit